VMEHLPACSCGGCSACCDPALRERRCRCFLAGVSLAMEVIPAWVTKEAKGASITPGARAVRVNSGGRGQRRAGGGR